MEKEKGKIKIVRLADTIKGYTLIELLLVLAIISIFSVAAIATSFRYNQLASSLLNDVHSVNMYIREMQNKTASFVAADQVSNIGYGVFLDLDNKNKIESFYKSNTGIFSPGEATAPKPGESLLLDPDNYFSKICINGCSSYSGARKVAIYFLKPKSYAIFSIPEVKNTSGNYIDTIPDTYTKINKVCLEISSYNGDYKRRIDIHYVGQISFASGPCQ